MKEITDIIHAYHATDSKEIKMALATVIHVAGSSYRRAGARMLIRDNGEWTGGISGGCLEGDALKKANYCMARNKVEVIRYDTSSDDGEQIGIGLGCEGIIDVLLAPLDLDDEENPIAVLESCLGQRSLQSLITVIASEQPALVKGKIYTFDDSNAGLFPEALRRDIASAMESGRSVIKEYEGLKVFIEILHPPIHLVLFGNNYDILPMLRMGRELGWAVSVVMNPVRAKAKLRELAAQIYPKDSEVPVDAYTAFILMAHDYETDKNNLARVLPTDVPYIGMLGPVKRRKRSLEELEASGLSFSEEQLARLYNPIGLDIGATTPEEIALSALAEIKAHFAQRRGMPLRERVGAIHTR